MRDIAGMKIAFPKGSPLLTMGSKSNSKEATKEDLPPYLKSLASNGVTESLERHGNDLYDQFDQWQKEAHDKNARELDGA